MPTLDFTQDRAEDVTATHRLIFGQYYGPSSYVQGGDSVKAADLKLGVVALVLFEPVALDQNNANPRVVDYDEALSVVRWFELTTGAEVAGGVNLSQYDARFMAVGH